MSLRHVNVLFAERVGGCSVKEKLSPLGGSQWMACGCCGAAHNDASRATPILASYSSSLDATWSVVAGKGWFIGIRNDTHATPVPCVAVVSPEQGSSQDSYAIEATPALALVLAALRAAGVDEETIQNAKDAP